MTQHSLGLEAAQSAITQADSGRGPSAGLPGGLSSPSCASTWKDTRWTRTHAFGFYSSGKHCPPCVGQAVTQVGF